jgi:hypothetical protein
MFRGWNTHLGWIHGWYAEQDGTHYISPRAEDPTRGIRENSRYTVDRNSIGRCTGKRDKDGILVFEGDVLVWVSDKGIDYASLVGFGDGFYLLDMFTAETYWFSADYPECAVVAGSEYELNNAPPPEDTCYKLDPCGCGGDTAPALITINEEHMFPRWRVQCPCCGARTTRWQDSSQAVSAWNEKRAIIGGVEK